MAKTKSRRGTKIGKPRRVKPLPKRPRNPFVLVVRRRAAGPEPSPRAYRRRSKHAKPKPDIEPDE